jgi:hypothetical protein
VLSSAIVKKASCPAIGLRKGSLFSTTILELLSSGFGFGVGSGLVGSSRHSSGNQKHILSSSSIFNNNAIKVINKRSVLNLVVISSQYLGTKTKSDIFMFLVYKPLSLFKSVYF